MSKVIKIGVFDSGIGGITVLTELQQRLGPVDYVYLGDTAHVPYGTKSPAQIEKLSMECALILRKKNIDALVVACNTASSLALEAIKTVMAPLPVFGVVMPGVDAAIAAHEKISSEKPSEKILSPILVLATRATVQSHAYKNALAHSVVCPVLEQACPLLVPMIEEGWIDHPILLQTIAEYVQPHLSNYPTGVALLGCTHYPWIHDAFEKALPGWKVVNSSYSIVQSLEKSQLLAQNKVSTQKISGKTEWIFTDPEAVPEFAKRLMRGD